MESFMVENPLRVTERNPDVLDDDSDGLGFERWYSFLNNRDQLAIIESIVDCAFEAILCLSSSE